MRLVVLDRSLVLPAFRNPTGDARRLLVVFAYGAAATYARFGAAEKDLATEAGGVLGGRDLDDVINGAGRGAARLAEQLPDGTPDDLVLAVSPPLLSQYQGVLRDHGPNVGMHLSPEETLKRRLELASIAYFAAPDFELEGAPYSGNTGGDIAVHTALVSQAEFVVTEVAAVAWDRHGGVDYTGQGHSTKAMRLDTFIASEVNTLQFDLEQVNGRLLASALRP